MKITKSYLEQIIKEELEKIEEAVPVNSPDDFLSRAVGINDPAKQDEYIRLSNRKDAIIKAKKAGGLSDPNTIQKFNDDVTKNTALNPAQKAGLLIK